MRERERLLGLIRAPKLTWDVVVRGHYTFNYDMMTISMNRMSMAKRLNLFKSGANLVHRKLMPWSMPLHMQIELTNYCNLQCPVCPTGIRAVKRKPVAMDVDLFERLIDEVGPYLLTLSLWAWGEPLLHPELERILRAARKHDIAILLSTNGQKLDDERLIEALTNHPPTYLIVAIDGLTNETNSKFRSGAKLEPVLTGVRKIAAIKRDKQAQLPILHMRYIVMKHNQHEMSRLQTFAADNDFDLLTVRTLSIIDADTEALHNDLIPDLESLQAYDYNERGRLVRDDYICQEPFWFPTVFADGTLVPCEQDFNSQQAMGVLSEDVSFADLWYGEKAARIRELVRDTPEDLSFCVNCPYRDRESTHCSVEAHVLNNEIDFANAVRRRG
jgi:radical SAM protein with 4Fe4S-binding SPASM domain